MLTSVFFSGSLIVAPVCRTLPFVLVSVVFSLFPQQVIRTVSVSIVFVYSSVTLCLR